MWAQVQPLGTVATINHAFVTDLNVTDGRVAGVWFFDRTGARRLAAASAVLLATGGAGQVFSETTNPAVATGDGIALAFNAGARVADLEFVQFHPTALKKADAPRFLISEALRGEGARLINVHGNTFMTQYIRTAISRRVTSWPAASCVNQRRQQGRCFSRWRT